MPPSKVIRIDEEVWAELQQRARPLEDTPNSVLRRVFGLPEESSSEDDMDPRIARLIDLVRGKLGDSPQVCRVRKNYSLLSKNEEMVAYIRPQRQKLRIGARKESAEIAGLGGWDRERSDGFLGGPSVRWYVNDDNDAEYQQTARILESLWKSAS